MAESLWYAKIPSGRDVGTYLFGFAALENREASPAWQKILCRTDRVRSWLPMSRFLPNAKHSLDSLLTDHWSGRGRTSFLPSPVPLAHSPERGGSVPAKTTGLRGGEAGPT